MLGIRNIRYLSKTEGFLDRINPPETVLRVVIDDDFFFPNINGTTTKNITNWDQHVFPAIQMSPYQKIIKLEFFLYQDGVKIGAAISIISYSVNKKLCIDTLDSDSGVIGKLYFEIIWTENKSGDYLTFQQFCQAKQKGKNDGGKSSAIQPVIQTQRKYVKVVSQDDCGGFCGCFAVRKKKTRTPQQIQQSYQQTPPMNAKLSKQVIQPQIKISTAEPFKNIPFMYFENELEAGRSLVPEEPGRLIYYSKTFVKSR